MAPSIAVTAISKLAVGVSRPLPALLRTTKWTGFTFGPIALAAAGLGFHVGETPLLTDMAFGFGAGLTVVGLISWLLENDADQLRKLIEWVRDRAIAVGPQEKVEEIERQYRELDEDLRNHKKSPA